VRALAQKGLRIRAIARVLKVAHTTVLERIKRSRKGKPKRRRGKISSPM
jgi:transposase-like protein